MGYRGVYIEGFAEWDSRLDRALHGLEGVPRVPKRSTKLLF